MRNAVTRILLRRDCLVLWYMASAATHSAAFVPPPIRSPFGEHKQQQTSGPVLRGYISSSAPPRKAPQQQEQEGQQDKKGHQDRQEQQRMQWERKERRRQQQKEIEEGFQRERREEARRSAIDAPPQDAAHSGRRRPRYVQHDAPLAREVCSRCIRPAKVCVCCAFPASRLPSGVQVVILQHPAETKRRVVSSVPLIGMVMENVHVAVGVDFPEDIVAKTIAEASRKRQRQRERERECQSAEAERGEEEEKEGVEEESFLFWEEVGEQEEESSCLSEADAGRAADRGTDAGGGGDGGGGKPLLFYPTPSSVNIEDLARERAARHQTAEGGDGSGRDTDGSGRDTDGMLTLVLLDGTWSQAKSLLARNPFLVEQCSLVQIADAGTSQYEFRREPFPHCLSTLESVAYAAKVLDPDTKRGEAISGALKKAFLKMVELQVRIQRETQGADGGGAARFVNRKERTANRALFNS